MHIALGPCMYCEYQPRSLPGTSFALLTLVVRIVATPVTLMADTRDTENVHFLAGQVHALVGFCIAIINSHPSPSELRQHIEAAEHVTLAHVESTLVIEDFLDGVRNVFDRLKIAAEGAEARQAEQIAAAQDTSEKSDWEEAAAAQVTKQRQRHS